MRIFFTFLFFLSCGLLFAEVLIDQSFDDPGPGIPADWSAGGINGGADWYVSPDSLAGGSPNELCIDGNIASTGETYTQTQFVDIYPLKLFTLSFRHRFTGSTADVTIRVLADDGTSPLYELYSNSDNPGVNIDPVEVVIPFENPFPASGSLRIRFQIETSGASMDFTNWIIDDVLLERDIFKGVLTPAGNPWNITDAAWIPAGDTLLIEPGVELVFSGGGNVLVEGHLEIAGTETQPVTATQSADLDYCAFRNWSGTLNANWLVAQDIQVPGSSPANVIKFEGNAISGTLTNCQFINCDTRNGTINTVNTDLTLTGCTFTDNSAQFIGGGIRIMGGNVSFDQCTFTGNQASIGGAIDANGTITVTDCIFTGNSCTNRSGALTFYNATATVSGCTFDNNSSQNEGGAVCNLGSTTLMDDCDFTGNTASVRGGAIYKQSGDLTLTNCTFDSNDCPDGGAIYNQFNSLIIDGATFDSNTSTDQGGAIHTNSATLDLTGCSFTGNTATTEGGALYDELSDVTIFGCTFSASDAGDGGAIYHDQNLLTIDGATFTTNTTGNRGASIYSNDGTLTCTDSEFSGNTASNYSGGIFADYGAVDISGCTFTGNTSGNKGGAACTSNLTLNVDACLFSGNSATNYGGGIYSGNCTMNVSDTDFLDNTSAHGGAVRSYICVNQYDRVHFSGNEGTSYGSAMQLNFDSGAFRQTIFTDNSGTEVVYLMGSSDIDFVQCTFTGNTYSASRVFTLDNTSQITLNSSILWNNASANVSMVTAESAVNVLFSDIQGGEGSIGGFGTLSWGDGNIDSNPLFMDAPGGDYRLTVTSPCIDTGAPSLPTETDGSTPDMGAFSTERYAPTPQTLTDVPNDQGRQLFLLWTASGLDSDYAMTEFYSVWRLDTIPSRNAIVIDDPADLPAQPDRPVVLMRDTEVWSFIEQIPAMNFDTYSLVAPTLADSSATGLNQTTFMIWYHDTLGMFSSIEATGYSMDNIAPDTPAQLALEVTPGTLQLTWEEVTCGTLDGNSYPEQNGVWYKVYAGDNPNFVCDETTLVSITQTPQAAVSIEDVNRRFFKVVASDQAPVGR